VSPNTGSCLRVCQLVGRPYVALMRATHTELGDR
jgi:hypothetical protein